MDWLQKRMLDLTKEKDRKKALVYDGTGKYIRKCNFCGKEDLVFPVAGIFICPRCMKRGWWKPEDIIVFRSGFCDICGVHALGAIAYVRQAFACFRCEWYLLGKKRGALRVGGTRIC